MKSCDTCKVVVDDEVSSCPKCGRSLKNGSDNKQSHAVSKLLAAANLHRIRGEANAAIDKCTEALELMPDNPDTHSLLGDIYESAGNLEEAVKWYQMAVDLKPESALDSAKLEQIEALLHKSRQEQVENTTGGWLLGDTKRDTGLSKIVLFSVLTVIVLAAFGLTALFLRFRAEQSKVSERQQPHYEQPITGRPEEIQTTTPPTSTDADPQVIARPIVEQQLLTSLATNPAILSRRLIMEDVKIDPRTEVLMLIFRLSDSEKPITRINILRHAAVTAAAAFAASPNTTRIEVRVLAEYQTRISPREPRLVLVTDVTRQVSGLDVNQASGEQLKEFFTRTWWGPELAQ